MHHNSSMRHTTALSVAAAAVFLAVFPALAERPAVPVAAPAAPVVAAPAVAPAPKCVVAPDLARFDQPLSRLSLRLSGGLPIKIVAIGSSSTWGMGTTTLANSYPSRLQVELDRHFPGHEFTVINRGVNGEEAVDMLARFETGVIAENPHLVIWQVGTNSLLRDRPLDSRDLVLHRGLARLKAIRTDVVLMDPQYAPRVIAKPAPGAVVSQIAAAGRQDKVGVFRRYEIMRRWHETEGLPFESFVTSDGLHMNDWGYGCLAKTLGFAIAEAATRPTETASAPPAAR
ncbi:MAG: acyl-CoA thioesterase [Alphaproteobacteria bacterium]|nr:acyl-CoA thioesterase [Alphaproteobacteria bacterium]